MGILSSKNDQVILIYKGFGPLSKERGVQNNKFKLGGVHLHSYAKFRSSKKPLKLFKKGNFMSTLYLEEQYNIYLCNG